MVCRMKNLRRGNSTVGPFVGMPLSPTAALNDLQFCFVSCWKSTDSNPGPNGHYCIFGTQA